MDQYFLMRRTLRCSQQCTAYDIPQHAEYLTVTRLSKGNFVVSLLFPLEYFELVEYLIRGFRSTWNIDIWCLSHVSVSVAFAFFPLSFIKRDQILKYDVLSDMNVKSTLILTRHLTKFQQKNFAYVNRNIDTKFILFKIQFLDKNI